MSGDAPISVAEAANSVRHMVGQAPNARLKSALEYAVTVLDYHASHPELMSACAFFLKHQPATEDVLRLFVGARITAVRGLGDDDTGRDDETE